jgi:hypothetical protein
VIGHGADGLGRGIRRFDESLCDLVTLVALQDGFGGNGGIQDVVFPGKWTSEDLGDRPSGRAGSRRQPGQTGMSNHQDCQPMFNRQTAQHPDELAGLRTRVFIAGEYVREIVEDYEFRSDRCSRVDNGGPQWCGRYDAALTRDAEYRILAGQRDDMKIGELFEAEVVTGYNVFQPPMDFFQVVFGAHIEDGTGFWQDANPSIPACGD